LYHAKQGLQSGDPYRQLIGTLNAAGIAFPPAAVMSATGEYVAQPGAQLFYETARKALNKNLGKCAYYAALGE
jgi:xanthine dehydrogenase iron-sulfur cluster and FAD-binding subunit A